MNKNEQEWTRMNKKEQEINKIEQEWTKMNKNEQEWTRMNKNEQKWTKMNKNEHEWWIDHKNEQEWIRINKNEQKQTRVDKNCSNFTVSEVILPTISEKNLQRRNISGHDKNKQEKTWLNKKWTRIYGNKQEWTRTNKSRQELQFWNNIAEHLWEKSPGMRMLREWGCSEQKQ